MNEEIPGSVGYYIIDSIHDTEDQWHEVTREQFEARLQENLERQEQEHREGGAA